MAYCAASLSDSLSTDPPQLPPDPHVLLKDPLSLSPSVLQDDGFAGAGGEQGHGQGAGGRWQLDPNQEMRFPCCPTHL